ncbi:hypothetical protein [Acidianus sp. HS-5]|uniref:hypothetical protein n=1 Tax=Acidianus sp. HS-5 TaxID=2886040 RepID=UPI001F3C9F4C|nr:hypothetical protein [Acidianus sp. HS-5]BDC17708.1 hypothetical protein HS5_05980 [Acidianus sp. HS-5]
MSSNNIKVVSMTRKIQVLDRFQGYCPICGRQTSQILAYVYRKEKMPIPLIFVTIRRYLPDFYGVICENCHTLLKANRYSKDIAKKYGRGRFTSKHKNAIEQQTRKMEIKMIKNNNS